MNAYNLQFQTITQSEIYQDLSFFLQIFKRSVSIVQKITIMLQKHNDHIVYLQMLTKVLEELQPLIDKYRYLSDHIHIQEITYHRFISRLLEIINVYKIKYQNAVNSSYYCHVVNIFINFLKETEIILKKNQIDRTLFSLMKLINMAIIKFCSNCKKNDENDEKHEELIISLKSINDKTIRIAQPVKKIAKRNKYEMDIQDDDQDLQVESRCDIINTIQSQVITSNQNNFTNNYINQKIKISDYSSNKSAINSIKTIKPLQKLNYNFTLFNTLDIDLSHLKTSHMYSKNNEKQHYKECLSRNNAIMNSINDYNKLFTRYRKKQELRSKRKVLNKNYNSVPNKYFQTKDRIKSKQIRLNDSIQEKLNYSSIDGNIQNGKLQPLKKSQNINESQQKNKKSYRLNNIYLSLQNGLKGINEGKTPNRSNINFDKTFGYKTPNSNTNKSNLSTNLNKLYRNKAQFDKSNLTISHIEQFDPMSVINSRLKINSNKNESSADIKRQQKMINRRQITLTQNSLQKEEMQLISSNISAVILKQEKSKRLYNAHYNKSSKSSQVNISSTRNNLKFTIRNLNNIQKQKQHIIESSKPY